MSKLRRTWITLLVAIGLLAGAGVAWAGDEVPEEPTDALPAVETMFNFGYDAENNVFLVNTSTTDAEYDCTLPANELGLAYGAVEGGFELEDELAGDSEGECIWTGGTVGGPNGQINHGQFMKLFHQLVDKKANRCLNRIIAQSDLGKGEQQVRTADVEQDFEASTTGTAMFETFVFDCENGRKEKGENHPGNNRGNKDKANKDEDGSPGNSGNARGRNK